MKIITFNVSNNCIDSLTGKAVENIMPICISWSEAAEQYAKENAVNGEFEIKETPDKEVLTVAERLDAVEKAVAVPEYVAGTWYYRGDRVGYNGSIYRCVAPDGVVCVWNPDEYPVYWEKC